MSTLQGVYAAAATPWRNGLEIDLAALFELLDFLSRFPLDGIGLFGATGEFIHFDIEQRTRAVSLCVKRSRLPIIAGVSHSTLGGAVDLGREAAFHGAAALLLMPPYPYPLGQEEVREFFLRFAESLEDDIPVLLYNAPQYTTGIAPETARELLCGGQFAGIKDSSGSWDYFARIRALRRTKQFSLFIGNDVVYAPARLSGADGVISGVACAVPELMTALSKAAAGSVLEQRLGEFLGWLERFPTPVAIREALRLRGLEIGASAIPLGAAARRDLEAFREWFRPWLAEVQKDCRG